MPELQTRDDLFFIFLPSGLYSLLDRCLVKNPDERATATELLQHEFILAAKPASILSQMIAEAREIRENLVYRLSEKHLVDSVSRFNDRFDRYSRSTKLKIFHRTMMKRIVGRCYTLRPARRRWYRHRVTISMTERC